MSNFGYCLSAAYSSQILSNIHRLFSHLSFSGCGIRYLLTTHSHTLPLKFAFAGAIRPVARILPPGPLEAPGHLGISFGLSTNGPSPSPVWLDCWTEPLINHYHPNGRHPTTPGHWSFESLMVYLHLFIDMHFRVVSIL